ncbi:hypothetical protein F5Y19DRAFT_480751 [Xylariaceae sp. FL1651]|nr:hypothetical protein F5Y19DRAFT_480751 [Xylariaceae sp. FL1651]
MREASDGGPPGGLGPETDGARREERADCKGNARYDALYQQIKRLGENDAVAAMNCSAGFVLGGGLLVIGSSVMWTAGLAILRKEPSYWHRSWWVREVAVKFWIMASYAFTKCDAQLSIMWLSKRNGTCTPYQLAPPDSHPYYAGLDHAA